MAQKENRLYEQLANEVDEEWRRAKSQFSQEGRENERPNFFDCIVRALNRRGLASDFESRQVYVSAISRRLNERRRKGAGNERRKTILAQLALF